MTANIRSCAGCRGLSIWQDRDDKRKRRKFWGWQGQFSQRKTQSITDQFLGWLQGQAGIFKDRSCSKAAAARGGIQTRCRMGSERGGRHRPRRRVEPAFAVTRKMPMHSYPVRHFKLPLKRHSLRIQRPCLLHHHRTRKGLCLARVKGERTGISRRGFTVPRITSGSLTTSTGP